MWWWLCALETVVCVGDSCVQWRQLLLLWEHSTFKSFDWFFLWYNFSRILKFILCVLGPKMCICTDNVANQEVFQISFPQFIWEAKYETLHTQLLEKECNVKYCVCTIHLFCNSLFPNVTFPAMLQFIIFLGTVFEVLKVLIYNAVWVSTPYSLVQAYECSGGSFWVCIHRQSKDGGSML